jgi:hypothetical protein
MEITGCPVRNNKVVWKNIAGEVVIADREGSTLRTLNKTASLIWILADGTRQIVDMVPEVCDKFETTPEQAQADIKEFCQELLQAGLISVKEGPHGTK